MMYVMLFEGSSHSVPLITINLCPSGLMVSGVMLSFTLGFRYGLKLFLSLLSLELLTSHFSILLHYVS